MRNSRIYAKALLETTLDSEIDALQTALDSLSELSKNAIFSHVMKNPRIVISEKLLVIREVCNLYNLPPSIIGFLQLLEKNSRFGLLKEIIYFVRKGMAERFGWYLGEIQTAKPLLPEELKKITLHYAEKFQAPVFFHVTVSTRLIHGMRLTINGVTYDNSLLMSLEYFKEFCHGAF